MSWMVILAVARGDQFEAGLSRARLSAKGSLICNGPAASSSASASKKGEAMVAPWMLLRPASIEIDDLTTDVCRLG